MFEISQLLKSYVTGLRALTGAEHASLFVPGALSGLSKPLLIEDGERPVIGELADLKTAIEFAAKTAIGEPPEGAETATLVVPGREAGVSLIPLPSVRGFWSGGLWPRDFFGIQLPTGGRRRTDVEALATDELPAAWLGLRLAAGEETLFEQLRHRELTSQLFGGEDASRWWEWLFSLGGALAGHAAQVSAILTDPITGLPDRTGFQAILSEAMQKSRIDQERFALLLVNPDEFASVNEALGRPQGDAIIRQIGDGLRSVLRASDPVSRYGGVIFAVVLPATTRDWAEGVGKKILQRLSGSTYLEGTVRLAFSIGFALHDPKHDAAMLPVQLFRQADQALNAAKRRGGGRVVEWNEEINREEAGACDKLTGIFTGNVSKDYRNMVLLWDTIDVIARSQDFDNLAEEVVNRLTQGLRLSRIGLFIQGADGEPVLKQGRSRLTTTEGERQLVQTLEPSEA
ncbi:MAG: GGDEF domain-containing protein, partial [Acidobacteriota bacterium]|nr:GGDEF domain-containing protein [Acidobacteriota bacterium]